MIRKSAFVVLLAAIVLYPAMVRGCDCRTAREAIEKNLEAVGGIEQIRAVESPVLKGASGSALLPPSEEVTLYLLKPDRLKQVGDFRVVLCDGRRFRALCVVDSPLPCRPTGISRMGMGGGCAGVSQWRGARGRMAGSRHARTSLATAYRP